MDQEGNPTDSPPERRLTLPERLAAAAAGIGEAITRTAGAAGAVISDGELRKRGAQVIADNASKGIRGIQYGTIHSNHFSLLYTNLIALHLPGFSLHTHTDHPPPLPLLVLP